MIEEISTPVKPCPCCGQWAEYRYSAFPLDYCLDKSFAIYKCTNCGHGTTGNIDQRDLEFIYEDGAYDPNEKAWHKILRPILNNLEVSKVDYLKRNVQKGNTLLEIGTGKGNFLLSAIKAGYDGYGVEPSSRSFEIAKSKLGNRVYQCTLEEIYLNSELNREYDFIFLWHVLEHLDDPENAVRKLKAFLKHGGLLIAGVPNFDSYQSQFGKSDWYHLDPPRHLSHFTPRSARFFFEKNALDVTKVFYNSFFQNLLGDIITLNNMILTHKNILLNVLRFNKFYFRKTHVVNRAFNLIAFIVISLIMIIPTLAFTYFSQWQKKSGTMVIMARKSSGGI